MKKFIINCIFLLFVGNCIIAAGTAYSQEAVLTLEIHNKSLKDVFRQIEDQSEFIFFYNEEAVDLHRNVDITVKEETIKQVLDKILDESSKYEIHDRQIVIYKNPLTGNAIDRIGTSEETKDTNQDRITLNGRVTDQEGESLIGVSILEKGTGNGVLRNRRR